MTTNSLDSFIPVSSLKSNEDEQNVVNVPSDANIINDYKAQAEIVYTNYINGYPRILSGKERRTIRREIERNAFRGKYRYMFDPEKIDAKKKRSAEAFDKINKG